MGGPTRLGISRQSKALPDILLDMCPRHPTQAQVTSPRARHHRHNRHAGLSFYWEVPLRMKWSTGIEVRSWANSHVEPFAETWDNTVIPAI